MRYLLDTNACIVYLNKKSTGVRDKISTIDDQQIVVCSIVKAELTLGAMLSHHPEKTLSKQQEFLNRFASLPFDDSAARLHGVIRADLRRKGIPIGPYDSLIAAIALAHDVKLITHNVREFSRVENLNFEDVDYENLKY